MSMDLTALVLAAPQVDAATRDRAATELGDPPSGVLVVRTCHRLEVVGTMAGVEAARGMTDARRLDGEEAARHLLRVAVGLESAVLAEDQVLHQLRAASREARARGALPPGVGRLVDTALHHGRRARTWMPAHRPSLADVALERVGVGSFDPDDRVTVIGRGPMGRGLAHAIARRGGTVSQSGRDGVPGPDDVGVAIALAGPWTPGPDALGRLVASAAWVIDLSAPSALPGEALRRLGTRVVTIDDLGADAPTRSELASGRLRQRLERLAEQAFDDYRSWVGQQAEHGLTGVRVSRAGEARARELEALWQRLPDLAPGQRDEIERMAERLSDRLLFGL
jgi:glutamyl-tRNA reductase